MGRIGKWKNVRSSIFLLPSLLAGCGGGSDTASAPDVSEAGHQAKTVVTAASERAATAVERADGDAGPSGSDSSFDAGFERADGSDRKSEDRDAADSATTDVAEAALSKNDGLVRESDSASCDDVCGSVAIAIGFCPELHSYSASPAQVATGGTISVDAHLEQEDAGAAVTFTWSSAAGTFATPAARQTTFHCTVKGTATLHVEVSDGTCGDTGELQVECL